MGYKRFSQMLVESLAKRRLCLGPADVMNCTPLSALSSERVCFPEIVAVTFSENASLRRQPLS